MAVLTGLFPGHGFAQTEDPAAEQELEPLDIGFVERTGRTLMFLDVEARDKAGRAMPGLAREDFKVTINYVRRGIYSVDDLCPCSPDPNVADPQPDPLGGDRARLVAGISKPVYILYFDFAQLQADGREQALEQARRFVDELMEPGDRVQIAAYSTRAGLRTLCPLTTDKTRLMLALEQAEGDPELFDPFPSQFGDRWLMCRDGVVHCYNLGKRDYMHSRRSLRALLNFVTELGDLPERKALLFFHQNNTIYPGRLYSGDGRLALGIRQGTRSDLLPDEPIRLDSDEFVDPTSSVMMDGEPSNLVPDLVGLLDQVGGTATATRTVVYPAVSGFGRLWTVNLGANLADFTGGRHNLGSADLGDLVDRAGRGCACIYRIGLEVPDPGRSKVYRTKVRIRGKGPLPRRYRVQHLTAADRWVRRAQAVLTRPDAAEDVGVTAALVPHRGKKAEWDLKVQVAVDPETLELLPSADHARRGEWEVGALLVDGHGVRTWEMLGVSRLLHGGAAGDPTATVVHERVFEGLRPGRYELRAFVRDRAARLYGGARAEIDLPRLRRQGLAGPVMLHPDGAHMTTDLPLRTKKESRRRSRTTRVRTGALPRAAGPLVAGEVVEFATWICPGTRRDALRATERGVFQNGERVLSFDSTTVRWAGDCVRVSDRLHTSSLAPGDYLYHFRWNRPAPDEARLAAHPFEVVAADLNAADSTAGGGARPAATPTR